MKGGDLVDERDPTASEPDEHAPTVVRVGNAFDQTGAFEFVQSVGHPAGAAHQGAVELGRRELVGCRLPAQAGEDVPGAAREAVAAHDGVDRMVEEGGEA